MNHRTASIFLCPVGTENESICVLIETFDIDNGLLDQKDTWELCLEADIQNSLPSINSSTGWLHFHKCATNTQ